MAKLTAGAARANITPYVGMYLSGFGGRDHGAEGIHDDLWARALVLGAGECRLALVACDLIGFTFASVAEIRRRAKVLCGIPEDHILIGASHTHSGPAVGLLRLIGQDPEWVAVVERKVAGAIAEAAAKAQPARLGFGTDEAQVGINRRERQADGTIRLGRNPAGLVDPTVGVLRVDAASGQPLATVIHHACHPVVLGGANYLISADFPGVATAFVERALPGVTALFLNGCGGNINSNPVGRTFDDAARLGGRLGAAAAKAYLTAEMTDEVDLRCATEWAEAPLRPLPPREEVLAQLQKREQALDADVAAGKITAGKRAADLHVGWAKDALAEWDKPERLQTRSLEVQAFAVGEGAFVTTPGETFLEIGRAIQEASPFRYTLVTGYTNGVIGYLPTDQAFEEGGYEVENAYRFYYGTYSLGPGTERGVVEAGLRALGAVA